MKRKNHRLRHDNKSTERRAQELSMSMGESIMGDVDGLPQGIIAPPEENFWSHDGPRTEICEPHFGPKHVPNEYLDWYFWYGSTICGTKSSQSNICIQEDLRCQRDGDSYKCMEVPKIIGTVCGTQTDNGCLQDELTCQPDGDSVSCQTTPEYLGTYCNTNNCLKNQGCDGEGMCTGGMDTCTNFGTACGGTCQENGICKYPDEAIPCTAGLCYENGTCDSKGSCSADLVDCDDGNECTINKCAPDIGCVTEIKKDGADCNTIACLADQTCQSGVCVEEGTDSCPETDNMCTVNTCDKITGNCTLTDKDDDTPCDTIACLADQTCQSGMCEEGTDSCPDGLCPGTCSLTSGTCNFTESDNVGCDSGAICQSGSCDQVVDDF